MNKNQKLLLQLLKCAIRGEKPHIKRCKKVDWKYIMNESKEHGVYPLLYPVIRDIPDPYLISGALKEKWKRDTFNTAVYLCNQMLHLGKVFKKFNEADIPVIALKGIFLRSLYPVPDLRTMSDADILIHEHDLEKVKNLLSSLGYTETKDMTPAHITFVHRHLISIEVHWTLADSRYIVPAPMHEMQIWTHAIRRQFGDTSVLCLCPEDFLMHMCTHMAAHIKSGGFGLRQLCDFVLFVEKQNSAISWQTFIKTAHESGIGKFTAAIFNVCNKLFDLQIPDEFASYIIDQKYIKALIYDIFSSGVFGMKSLERVFGNNLLNSEVVFNGEKAKTNSVLDIICPPVNSLSDAYSYAKKHHILIPIAWIHHFFAGVLHEKYSLFDKLKVLCLSGLTFRKRRKLIKSLDL